MRTTRSPCVMLRECCKCAATFDLSFFQFCPALQILYRSHSSTIHWVGLQTVRNCCKMEWNTLYIGTTRDRFIFTPSATTISPLECEGEPYERETERERDNWERRRRRRRPRSKYCFGCVWRFWHWPDPNLHNIIWENRKLAWNALFHCFCTYRFCFMHAEFVEPPNQTPSNNRFFLQPFMKLLTLSIELNAGYLFAHLVLLQSLDRPPIATKRPHNKHVFQIVHKHEKNIPKIHFSFQWVRDWPLAQTECASAVT